MGPPTLPARVTIPECLSPSSLAYADSCRLRVLAPTLEKDGSLPRGPAAERGVVFHQLLERAARGLIRLGHSTRGEIERDLTELLSATQMRLAASPVTAPYADLSSTLPALEWRNACRTMVSAAVRLSEFAAPPRVRPTPASGHERDLRTAGRAAEVPVRVTSLRIAGRIDAFERSEAGLITIRDYKTGRVVDSDGSVRHDIALQLRLYGLAVHELIPDADVRLGVCAGSDHWISFTAEEMAATRKWLDEVLTLLPAGASVSTETLASPGPACRTCAIRHACTAYLREIPRLWLEGTTGYVLPRDTWGEVVDVERSSDSVTLRLRDAAGRLVRVSRLAPRPELERFEKSAIWLFGLEVGASLGQRGQYLHPRNFHELPRSPIERRAWALAVYR